jgi:hypothetical protein
MMPGLVLNLVALLATPVSTGRGIERETLWLSGRGSDDAVPWEFLCTGGRNHGRWTTIPVPSNWELHGFGSYNYGHDPEPSGEDGRYRRRFDVPRSWRGRRAFLVFEGAMTDAEAWVNGVSAGARHQGGLYRFSYDVTRLLRPGEQNLLEVLVSKDSADESVNAAERQADYWVFGGLYRSVHLDAYPAEFIERTAIDARADGTFRMDVHLGHVASTAEVEAQILDSDRRPVGPAFGERVRAGQETVTLRTRLASALAWSSETPRLYRVRIVLRTGGSGRHRVEERFGFRTVEVKPDGIHVNGRKVLLKGINRHSFWPETGRATSASLSRADVELIKDMNANAVRTSHYPPDEHFLDACDEQGLYVLDELAGWQAPPYDTGVGRRLVREMVLRDRNHPSVILWASGNEGGTNPELDPEFVRHDPQRRAVLHPDLTAAGVATKHYPSWAELERRLEGPEPYLPTELLHGLYDGGLGAGLADFWTRMRASARSAGGFLWALLDEAVVRTDRGGSLDADGNHGPDGIVGPHREKEGSFFTVREVWSPLSVLWGPLPEDFAGEVPFENRHDFTDAAECRFEWSLLDFPEPEEVVAGAAARVAAAGSARSASVPPGAAGRVALGLPADWRSHDALGLRAFDPSGRAVLERTWPLRRPADVARRIVRREGGPVAVKETAEEIVLRAAQVELAFSRESGKLVGVIAGGRAVSFGNGPVLAATNAAAWPRSVRHHTDGTAHVVEADYAGNLRTVRWTLFGSGWLQLDYAYRLPRRGDHADHDFLGVSFHYPESRVRGVTWLGRGPYRVWKNRLMGPALGLWTKEANDAETGVSWVYPEFKGYHADLYWAVIRTTEQDFVVATETAGLFLRLYTPRFTNAGGATAAFPTGDISFLHAIAPIGNKFQPAAALGPEGGRNLASGDFSATLYFFFGDLPPRTRP